MGKFSKFFAIILTFVCVIGMLPSPVAKAESNNTFENKTISILGDSISTFDNVSCGTAAETTNSSIKNNRAFYKNGNYEVTLNDTWWMQVNEKLGTKTLVNNSYSGSTIFSPFSKSDSNGYLHRPYNLHDNTGENAGEEPDIIVVFMGTNDVSYHRSRVGTYDNIDFNTLYTYNNGVYTYKEPTTSCEAYAIMLHKIKNTYKNAEIYCFSLLPKITETQYDKNILRNFNTAVNKLSEKYGCNFVDIYNDSGITDREEIINRYLIDGYIHPNNQGMDAITSTFISSLFENSKYAPDSQNVCNVDYDLVDVIVKEGTQKNAIIGTSYSCSFSPLKYGSLNVTVKMNGEDITDSVYRDKTIIIPEVTGDIEIQAHLSDAQRNFYNYRFENNENNVVSISGNENTTINVNSVDSGYVFDKDINLFYDQNWSVVFRLSNIIDETVLLTSDNSEKYSLTIDPALNVIGFKNHIKNEFFGCNLSELNLNYTDIHTFKITNEYNVLTGTTKLVLFVDSKEIGSFNTYYLNGELINNPFYSINEVDFNFNKTNLQNDFSYIQIWENNSLISHQHTFEYSEQTEPTCVEYGSVVTTCDCGEKHFVPVTEPTGHKETDWLLSKETSAVEPGEYYKKCTVCNETTQTKAIPQLKCGAPVISNLANTEDGVKIYWNRVEGADYYRIYHRQINGSWIYLGSTTSPYYFDTNVKGGYWYYYTVRAVNEVGYSNYNKTGKIIQALDTPDFSTCSNTHTGIYLKWNSVYGAKGYYIYRKIGNNNWEYYANTKSTSYTDKQVYNGGTYSYRIRAYRNDTVSGYHYEPVTAKRFVSPQLKTPLNTDSGIKIQWNKVANASGYFVYRKTGNSYWEYIGKTTGTSFTDTKAVAGQTYTYTVKAYDSSGLHSSYNTTGVKCKRLLTPNIYDNDIVYNGIKVKWNGVKGASGYYVYRKTANGSWQYLGKTTSKYYTDKTAKKGVQYTYTVRAYSGSYTSTYNAKGTTAKR